MEPLRVKDNVIGGVRNVQKVLKVILKGDGSLDGLYSRLVERFKVLWTPQVSGYQMESLGVKDNLTGGVTNIQKAVRVILKRDESLDGLLSRLVEIFKVFWTPQVSGYQMEPSGVKNNLI